MAGGALRKFSLFPLPISEATIAGAQHFPVQCHPATMTLPTAGNNNSRPTYNGPISAMNHRPRSRRSFRLLWTIALVGIAALIIAVAFFGYRWNTVIRQGAEARVGAELQSLMMKWHLDLYGEFSALPCKSGRTREPVMTGMTTCSDMRNGAGQPAIRRRWRTSTRILTL